MKEKTRVRFLSCIARAACALGVTALVAATPLQALAATSGVGPCVDDLRAGNAAVALQSGKKAYTVPVRMLKLKDDAPSMAAPVLHGTAYAECVEGNYRVTVYLVNATIMSTTIYADSLGKAAYDQSGDGTLVPVDADEYDASTQVRSVTMTVGSLDSPVLFHMDMFMDAVRLSFDSASMVETANPPVFPDVASSGNGYPAEARHVVGGSGYDGANRMARFANGNIVVAGDTASTDGSFSDRTTNDEVAYLSMCSGEGEVLANSYLTGADSVSILGLDASPNGTSFYACGYFQMKKGVATGTFEGLTPESAKDTRNAFIAKFDSNNQLKWVKALTNSGQVQYDGVVATQDGGCAAVAEMLRSNVGGGDYTGSYSDEMAGIVSSVVVKYDAEGNEQWHRMIDSGSGSLADTGGAITQLADGTYLVGGAFTHSTGVLEGLERFGGTFDIYVLRLDAQGMVIKRYSYGGNAVNEDISAIAGTADGGFAFVGDTASTDGTFEASAAVKSNGYIVKCNANGEVEWVDTHKSSKACEATSLAVLEDAYVVLGEGEGSDGDFQGLSKGHRDAYVAVYDERGDRVSLLTFGGSSMEYAGNLAIAGDGTYLFLVESSSSDVDMQGISRGKADAVVVSAVATQAGQTQKGRDAMAAAQACALIDALPDASEITLSHEPLVREARDAFDALNAEATLMVPATSIAHLQAAERALSSLGEGNASRSDVASPGIEVGMPPAEEQRSGNSGGADLSPSVGEKVQGSRISAKARADVKAVSARTVEVTAVHAEPGATVTVDSVILGGKVYKVSSIAKGAFMGCKAAKVVVGDSVKTIGKGAFKNARHLKKATLGKGVRSVGSKAFAGCKKLKTVTLKSSKLTQGACKALLSGSEISKVRLSGVSKKAAQNYKIWLRKAGRTVCVQVMG